MEEDGKIREITIGDVVYKLFPSHSIRRGYSEAITLALKDKRVVYSVSQVLMIKSNTTDNLRDTWVTCATEEDIGKTNAGNSVLIVVHGGGIITPITLDNVLLTEFLITNKYLDKDPSELYKPRLTKQRTIQLSRNRLESLLNGKIHREEERDSRYSKLWFEDRDTEIPVYTINDIIQERVDLPLPRRYAIIMDFKIANKSITGYVPIDKLRNDHLFIARAGSVAVANAFIEKIGEQYDRYGNWHSFNELNPDETQGYMLRVSNVGYEGINRFEISSTYCFCRFLIGPDIKR